MQPLILVGILQKKFSLDDNLKKNSEFSTIIQIAPNAKQSLTKLIVLIKWIP